MTEHCPRTRGGCRHALDPHGHRPYIPDERDRNRGSVSKSICHREFPESTRACARAQGSGHSEFGAALLIGIGTALAQTIPPQPPPTVAPVPPENHIRA
jgi:hypothetical protein